jgi:hypothetical protein
LLLIPFRRDVLDATLCDRVCQSFSLATLGSSTNKTNGLQIIVLLALLLVASKDGFAAPSPKQNLMPESLQIQYHCKNLHRHVRGDEA